MYLFLIIIKFVIKSLSNPVHKADMYNSILITLSKLFFSFYFKLIKHDFLYSK